MIYFVRATLIILYTVFWGVVGCASVLFDRSGETVVRVARRWIGWILATSGVRVRIAGLEHIEPGAPYVFMSNHQSHFDVAALIHALPVSWRFVAKKELTYVPFFGWAMVLGGHIIVDRGRRSRAIESLDRAAARIRGGTNVIIFPEGTRGAAGDLAPFKSGGFHLALGAGVPIVPVSVSGSQFVMSPEHRFKIDSGEIVVRFGQPIPTADLDVADRNALKERVREAILRGFEPGAAAPVRGALPAVTRAPSRG